MKSSLKYLTALWLLAVLFTCAQAADRQSYDDLDQPMRYDPDLTIPEPIHLFDDRLAQLWTDALQAPEAEVRRRSAETMAFATRIGMEGLEIAVPRLKEVAIDGDEVLLVRFAALRALVALDAQSEADTILQSALAIGSDAEADALDALARWKHAGAQRLWRGRLGDKATAHRELLLAIQGLAAISDTSQNTRLKELVQNQFESYDVRLGAARALAELETSGLETISAELLKRDSPRRERLLAATLLRRHEGSSAEELLEQLILDQEPTVASAALERIIEIAPQVAVEHQNQLLSSRDANVRRWTVQCLVKFPSPEHTTVLARVTNDVNPGIRVLARNGMLSFAQEHDLRTEVLEQADKLLTETDWRGIEQACRLIGSLDHKPAATQLLTVLPHPRIEAHATAAWALRKIAVPETLPEILTFVTPVSEQAISEFRGGLSRDYDPQLLQIFQFFGEAKYEPADPLLRRFVPKLSMSTSSRCAAIWALGHIHAGDAPADLADALVARLSDVGVSLPEMEYVRSFCAVSLGRMKAEAAMPALRRFYEEDGSYTPAGYGCGWAIEQITGEPVEKPIAPNDYHQGFFLMPLN